MEDKKKNIIIILLVVIIVLLVGLLYVVLTNKKDNNETSETNDGDNKETKVVEEKLYPGIKIDNNEKYDNYLIVYYDKDEEEFCYFDNESDCSSKKISIKTESKDAKKLSEYEDDYVFYKDNGKIKYYSANSKKSYVINIASEYKSYNFMVDNVTKELVGVFFRETLDDYYSYYSLIIDKTLYEKKYRELSFLSKDYLAAKEFSCNKSNKKFVDYDTCKQTKLLLLSAKEEKVLKTTDANSSLPEQNYDILYNDKGVYFTRGYIIDDIVYDAVYTESLEKVTTKKGRYDVSIGTDGNLYVNEKGIVSSYDKDGKKLKSSKKYTIKALLGEYMVIAKNKKLLLVNIDGEETEVTSWNGNKKYIASYSGFDTENDNIILHLAIEDKSLKTDTKWDYCQTSNKCGSYIRNKEEAKDAICGYYYHYNLSTKKLEESLSCFVHMFK